MLLSEPGIVPGEPPELNSCVCTTRENKCEGATERLRLTGPAERGIKLQGADELADPRLEGSDRSDSSGPGAPGRIDETKTGGAGFIGSNLAEYLLNRDLSVVVVDNLSTGREENLAGWSEGAVVADESRQSFGQGTG